MAQAYYSQISDLQLPEGRYVLVLPSWYPTSQDKFAGDFNQRQVLAAGMFTPQVVLYIGKDLSKTLRTVETRYVQVNANIVEITVIYPAVSNKWIDAVYSNWCYVKLLCKYAEVIKKRWGKPLLLHSYIAVRGGFASMLLKKKWRIPFILTEHWTIYYTCLE
jgi:hypothetical protein